MSNMYCLRIIPMILLLALLSTAATRGQGNDPPGMNPLPMLPLVPIDTTGNNAPADTTNDTLTERNDTLADPVAVSPAGDSSQTASPLGRTDMADTVEGDSPGDTTAALLPADSTEEEAITDTGEESAADEDDPETMEEAAREGDFPPRDTERVTERDDPQTNEDANPLGRSAPPDSLNHGQAVTQHSPEPPPWTRTERTPMQGLRPVGEEDESGLAPMAQRPLEFFEREDEDDIEPRFEITPWVGATFFREGGQPWAGLRFAEVAFWPSEKARIWVQYDNGLSFDNLRVARSTESTPALYAGGFLNYEENHISRAEIGIRTLPGNITQLLARTEQVYVLSDGHSVKGGLWFGPRSDGKTEWILHLGGGVPVSRSIRLDPTFFYSRSGDPGQKEWRLLVSGEFMLMDELRIAGGVAGGIMELGNGWKQGVAEEFLKVTATVEDFYQLHALFKNETVGPRRGITVLAAGFTWGFGGR